MKLGTKYGYNALRAITGDRLPEIEESRKNQIGNALAILTGLGTTAYSAANKADFNNLKDSLLDPDYWDKNPLANIEAQKPQYTWYQPPASGIEKDSSAGFSTNNIPINFSMSVIDRDPFLDVPRKQITNQILYGSENKSAGYTNKSNLLSLPPKTVKNLSLAGGVAGAVANVL
jgi:hypothetical protein